MVPHPILEEWCSLRAGRPRASGLLPLMGSCARWLCGGHWAPLLVSTHTLLTHLLMPRCCPCFTNRKAGCRDARAWGGVRAGTVQGLGSIHLPGPKPQPVGPYGLRSVFGPVPLTVRSPGDLIYKPLEKYLVLSRTHLPLSPAGFVGWECAAETLLQSARVPRTPPHSCVGSAGGAGPVPEGPCCPVPGPCGWGTSQLPFPACV